MNARPRLLLVSLALALASIAAPLDAAEPRRVEALRGKTTFTRQGMVQRLQVASPVMPGDAMATSSGGQAQLDAGAATVRAGSATDLQLSESGKGLTLKKGIVLVSNKTRRQGFDLETERHRASSHGTMQVSYLKDKYLKVLCVEGTVKVGLKALFGDSVTLRGGQMVTITPTSDQIPAPVDVNLERLAATSALLSREFVQPGMDFPGGLRVTAAITAQELVLAQAAMVPRSGSDRMLADSAKILDHYTNPKSPLYNESKAAEFAVHLGKRPATIENMFHVLGEASSGVPCGCDHIPLVPKGRMGRR